MNASLIVSATVTLATALLAALWASLVATGMAPVPETEPQERRDIRTW
ncbi:hypothetical protein [Methylobacterium pseudosasicola]|uniref:Uncharacterized protein n=1 Tax=Methylobacterium pseudosasicola TaxID=582667 RepID=A0A1I4LFA1_9HYPH|nr:hypothetical protein [Methylobacterium pseudosasicola]SFL89579.1 hypothetical protein SAMN05192568_101393 [Methylobacterium pseudosasicola]